MRKFSLFMLMAVGLLISGNAGAEESTVEDFSGLQTALESAQAGDVITLTDKITINSSITIPKNVTVNGGGKAWTVDGSATITVKGTATNVTRMTVKAGSTFSIDGGTVNLNNSMSTITGTLKVINKGTLTYLSSTALNNNKFLQLAANSTLNINEGSIKIPDASSNVGVIGMSGSTASNWTISMNDATINAPYCKYGIELSAVGNSMLTNVTFIDNSKAIHITSNVSEPITINLIGSIKSNDVVINNDNKNDIVYDESKKCTVTYSDGGGIVEPTYLFEVKRSEETVKYETVDNLEKGMQGGDEIKLLDNVELNSTLTFTKSVTLDLNGYTISPATGYAANDLITISDYNNLGNFVPAHVTFKSSKNGGLITSACAATINIGAGSNPTEERPSLTIESGEYTNNIDANTIISCYGNLYIKGGQITTNSTATGISLGGGASCNISGGTFDFDPTEWVADGYAAKKVENYWVVEEVQTNDLVDFLSGEGTTMTLNKDYDLYTYGSTFSAVGTKTLDLAGYSVTIPKGMMTVVGDLTITNSGNAASFSSTVEPIELDADRVKDEVIKVAENGKLTIQGTNKNISIYGNTVGIRVVAGGQLVLDNANVEANYFAAILSGKDSKLNISNSVISSQSTSSETSAWSYAINAGGSILNMENTQVTGVQGAVGVFGDGCSANIRGCDLKAAGAGSHAALYVATNAVVNVWNTYMKSDLANYAAFVGNNDTSNEWGIINLYGGCLLSDKMYVQLKKNVGSTFPAYIPKNSAWYTTWKITEEGGTYTGEGPLPSEYTYRELANTEGAYSKGYRWEVIAPASTQDEYVKEDVTGTTIPWGEATTWSNNFVPNENTIATIPDKKPVVIGEQANAEAFQVFIGGNNASLTVSEDAFLTVGDGGMNIADGGQLIIEPGAVVKVGEGGVTNSSDDAIVIKAEEGKAGAFLIGPAVTEATHPYATVEMYTRAREISTTEHRWQHFAIPTIGVPDITPLPHDKQEVANYIYIYDWNYNTQEWQTLGSWDKLCTPFKGYNLTNNLPAATYQTQGGVTYIFHGNIIGNGDGDLQFLSKGYNFFGNSYTAPIDIKTMFESLDANIEKTIAIYDVEKDQYVYSNEMMIDLGFATNTQISPLQGFFLNAKTTAFGNPTIDYENAVYNNPNLEAGHGGLYAPAQKKQVDANTVVINVEANGNADCITLVAMDDLSNDFEDGFDATKLMNNSNLNIYANTMSGKLGVVATDELEGITMDFQSNDATQYTMTFANVNGQAYDLLDVMTGVRTRMKEGATYTFNADANSLVANRFQVCAAAYAPTQMESVKAKAAQGIHTVLGQPVGNNWNALPAGVYIINGVCVVK